MQMLRWLTAAYYHFDIGPVLFANEQQHRSPKQHYRIAEEHSVSSPRRLRFA